MESKISAQELMNVVTDTNRKVTELSKRSKNKDGAGKPYSKIGGTLVFLLSLVGVALSATVLFPEIAGMIGLALSDRLFRFVYVVYAAVALTFAATVRIRVVLRLWAVLVAVAPICILTVQSIV